MLNNELAINQHQTLSVNQVQSLEILAYNNQELERFLVNEYLTNPMLDTSSDKQSDMIKNLEQVYETGTSYGEYYMKWDEDNYDIKDDVRDENFNEIQELLIEQLCNSDYNDKEWGIIKYLIQCLDEKGFFPYETKIIANTLNVQENIVHKCLNVLKNLEPVGIFSKDISECLKKQLLVKGINDEKLMIVIEQYIPDLLKGNIALISRSLNLTTSKVRQYIHMIGSLNPRPIMNMQLHKIDYIVPDILVTLEKGKWNIIINDKWLGDYKYNEYYIHMMAVSEDDELKQYFKVKLERARFIIRCIEQRRNTIIKIVEEIFNFQENYFKYNDELKPMNMKCIAEKTNLHISTISRAIKDKYIQYKNTILIRDLFTASVSLNENISVDILKKQIKEIIGGENILKPLSDSKIADIIYEHGFKISRRTVAKYRNEMGILESRQRHYLS